MGVKTLISSPAWALFQAELRRRVRLKRVRPVVCFLGVVILLQVAVTVSLSSIPTGLFTKAWYQYVRTVALDLGVVVMGVPNLFVHPLGDTGAGNQGFLHFERR